MGRGREVSFNYSKCFSALVKISPCGKFENFKTNKTVLTIVIGLENILCWNLVESALERGDSNVPVYSPFLIFLFAILVHDVNKNTKASFWSLKEYKVFYTKFHSAQQNELYALIHIMH